jgi:hypothetical protein
VGDRWLFDRSHGSEDSHVSVTAGLSAFLFIFLRVRQEVQRKTLMARETL